METTTTHADAIAAAADEMAALATAITDDLLGRPTPCPDLDLGTMLGHIDMLSRAFAAAGRKEKGPLTSSPPDPAASELGDDWRETLPGHLRDLATSWRDPAAWEGMTQVGGIDAPGQVLGTVALSELVLHGWDVARSVGADLTLSDDVLQVVYDFHYPPQPQDERDGMFGPVVEVPADARLVDRLAGLTGRDPFWPHGSLEE
ncbi:TIGR03086 family metal-binding protein [Gordonia sp. CPCC 205515]|uniref:TIGR03086 family metal-binding protein n=1 Tax=Gordonia sp. CPCC 205515 TaxID=3140791 RepID=UPI003AF3C7A0